MPSTTIDLAIQCLRLHTHRAARRSRSAARVASKRAANPRIHVVGRDGNLIAMSHADHILMTSRRFDIAGEYGRMRIIGDDGQAIETGEDQQA